jgi:hypothetical protein
METQESSFPKMFTKTKGRFAEKTSQLIIYTVHTPLKPSLLGLNKSGTGLFI